MKTIKIGGAAVNQTPLDWDNNRRNLVAAIRAARREKTAILCLPELAISGYGCEDMFFSSHVLDKSLRVLTADILPETRDIFVVVGLPLLIHNSLYNAAAICHNGQLLGFYAKQSLCADGVYYEPRWFKPWQKGESGTVLVHGMEVPVGDFIFEASGVRVGVEICEDAWTGERPASDYYGRDVDIIVNPSASHFVFGKSRVREQMVAESSRAYFCSYVYANLLGNESGKIIFDGEVLLAREGEVLRRNRRFSFAGYNLVTAVTDLQASRSHKRKSWSFQASHAGRSLESAWELTAHPESAVEHKEPEPPLRAREEEFEAAQHLALFDYMRKSASRGFVLSLSGGADSSACLVLIAGMVRASVRELGLRGWLKKLKYWPELEQSVRELEKGADPGNLDELLMKSVLYCVYQATRNNQKATENAAKALATSVGARYSRVNIDKGVEFFTKAAENALDTRFNWEEHDIVLQNIQARTRAPLVWMLANARGALLVTTSNRSEADMGYATMDGDTAGGLAPLAGTDKAFLRRWLVWAEKERGWTGLEKVNKLHPTAELRPPEAGKTQTDEEDLMPYDLAVELEACLVRDYLAPGEALELLSGRTIGGRVYSEKELAAAIEKFYRLWSRNQWKRERYAPGFHVDRVSVDPRGYCRFPILNGGFREELKDLKSARRRQS